ncbi:MAG: shikimate kinase, partial [Pseudomonadota bacterium]
SRSTSAASGPQRWYHRRMALARNLIFIGPTGAGKTTVGKRVAQHFGLLFLDLDHEIERQTGADIPLIFDIEGEAGFRRRETNMLKSLSSRGGVLLATGGGAVVAEENREIMRGGGFIVYLATPVERQLQRLRQDKRRPLLSAPNRDQVLADMARDRNPIYENLADLTVQSEAVSVSQMARRVLDQIEQSDYVR